MFFRFFLFYIFSTFTFALLPLCRVFFGGLLSSTALHCSSSEGSIAFLCEFSFCCCCFCCCCRRIRTSLKCSCSCCYWCSSVQWTCQQQQQHYPTSKIGHICTFSHHHHYHQRHATVNSLRKLELLPGTSTSATVPVAAAAAFFCLPASYWQCHLVAQRPAECVCVCVCCMAPFVSAVVRWDVCVCVCVMCTALSLSHSLTRSFIVTTATMLNFFCLFFAFRVMSIDVRGSAAFLFCSFFWSHPFGHHRLLVARMIALIWALIH